MKKQKKIGKNMEIPMDQEVRIVRKWFFSKNFFDILVTHFGIALPKWLVDHQNAIFVLLIYTGIFMIVLPVIVVRKFTIHLFERIMFFFSVCIIVYLVAKISTLYRWSDINWYNFYLFSTSYLHISECY